MEKENPLEIFGPNPLDKQESIRDFTDYDLDQCKYRKAYVALIDILGYENIIKSRSSNAPRYLFNIIKNSAIKMQPFFEMVELKLFSDTIIIWNTQGEHLAYFLNMVDMINSIVQLFNDQNIFLRGGISFEDHFNYKDIIVSPAVIRSYNLESKYAIYPRIIVDDNIIDKLKRESIEEQKQKPLSFVEFEGSHRPFYLEQFYKDFDGKYILNPLLFYSEVQFLYSEAVGTLGAEPENMCYIRDRGVDKLTEYRYILSRALSADLGEKERMKIEYLVSQFNMTVSMLKLDNQTKSSLIIN